METLKQLFWEYRFILILFLIVAIYCLFEWQRAKVIAYSLMLQAKSLAKDTILKSGDQQADWVVKRAYQFLPKSLTIFISEDNMRKIIYKLYHSAKDYLDDGNINNSIQ